MKNFKLFLKVKIFNFKDKIFTIFNFYKNFKYFLLDSVFSFIYLFINPYREVRIFNQKKGLSDIYTYGETPIKTIYKIAKESNIDKKSNFLELGSGRGNVSFFIRLIFKCKVTAIEWVDKLINISKFLNKIFYLRIIFLKKDMFEISFNNFTHIYLYGTCLNEKEILKFTDKFKKESKKAKIITISYDLNFYDKDYKTTKSFDVDFAYGKTKAYINILKEHRNGE
ncbi:MAG: hypothetical protein K1060chlam5_00252 [Candidatus Anoxychlamydiales bacterium]|nr:hypothetical protein [Candidatus Anoxychlamydiales bacterium]